LSTWRLGEIQHQKKDMRILCTAFITLSLVAISTSGVMAQTQTKKGPHPASHHLTKNDRKALIAEALSNRVQQEEDGSDCSHLVHAIYESAGFPYEYAPSDDLYDGVAGFQRVKAPLPGDLVVWRGHVGIVIKPSKHTFFSSLRSGLDTDNYNSPYWKRRGQPRFYRYNKRASLHTAE
jgi:cell wall-associated NlpC family hydrolase